MRNAYRSFGGKPQGKITWETTCKWEDNIKTNFKVIGYVTVLLVLYEYKTYLTLREKHRLRVSVNRVLRRIFGSKREEVAGGWRRLHNEELHSLYAS
jgi:hypothetical protein